MTKSAVPVATPPAPRTSSYPSPDGPAGPAGVVLAPATPTLPDTPDAPAPPATAPESSGTRVWAALVATALSRAYLAFLATLLAVAVLPALGSWNSFVVQSGSMSPHINRGDVVVASPFARSGTHVPVGRVMLFDNPAVAPNATVDAVLVHRVVAHNPGGTFTTRGDDNRFNDSTPVPRSAFFARARLVAPKIGLPLLWWQDRQWLPLTLWFLLTGAAVGFAFRRTGVASDGSHPEPDAGAEDETEPDAGAESVSGDPDPRGAPVPVGSHAAVARALGLVALLGVATAWRGAGTRRALIGSVAMVTVLGLFSTGAGAARFTATTVNPANSWTVGAAPGTPTGPAVVQTGIGTATFSWTMPTSGGNPTGYSVYLDSVKVSSVSASTFTYPATGLSAASHTFGVAATNGLGPSAQASATLTIVAPPGTPTSPAAAQTGSGTATFTWAAPATGGTVTGYYVYVDGTKVATLGASTFTYPATGLTNASHAFAVSAYNIAAESTKASTALTILAVPFAPTSPAATQTGAGNATFTWAAPSGGPTPSGYYVYVDGTKVATVSASTFSSARTGLAVGDHTFAVSAYNALGESAKASTTLTMIAAPGTPTSAAVVQTGAGTATFTWGAPATGGPVTGYYVYIDNTKVATLDAATFTYPATGLSAASHSFAVSAYNAIGESSKASKSLTIVAAPGNPRSPQVSNSGPGAITIAWSAPSGGATPTGYRVYRSTSSTVGTATLIGTTTTRTYVDSGLTVGTRYYYWLTAYNVAGESSKVSAGNAVG